MSRRPFRAAVVAGTAISIVAAFAGPAQAATHWHTAVRIPSTASIPGTSIADVATASGHSVWAVGSQTIPTSKGDVNRPLVEHFNGHTWQRIAAPATPHGARNGSVLNAVVAGPHGVWVVGSANYGPQGSAGSFVARWTGTAWSVHNFGMDWDVAQLSAFAADNVRVLGVRYTANESVERGATAHWDGHRWATGTLSIRPAFESTGAIGQLAPAWAPAFLPGSQQPALLHWDGHRWARAAMPDVVLPKNAQSYDITAVLDRGHGDVWLTVGYAANEGLAAGLTLFHLTKSGWRRTLYLPHQAPTAIVSDGGQGLWIESAGLTLGDRLLHVTNDGTRLKPIVYLPTSGDAVLLLSAISTFGRLLFGVGAFYSAKSSTAVIERFTP